MQSLTFVEYTGYTDQSWQLCYPSYQKVNVSRTVNGQREYLAVNGEFDDDPVKTRSYGWLTNGSF